MAKLREVVPRAPIFREIKKVRKKLIELRKNPSYEKRLEAIERQLMQLELCEHVLFDIHIAWP